MRCSLSILLCLVSVFFEVKGQTDYDGFLSEGFDDLTPFSDPLFPDSSSDISPFIDPTEDSIPNESDPFDPLILPWEGMEPGTAVADCFTTGGLGARDGSSFCPTPPNDPVTDKFQPPNKQDDPLRNFPSLGLPAIGGNDNSCSIDKPYRLCCICNGYFEFDFCQDCLPMSQVGMCYSPHMEVCCGVYGVVQYDTHDSLDELLAQYDREKLGLNLVLQGGTIAQSCQEVVPPLAPLP